MSIEEKFDEALDIMRDLSFAWNDWYEEQLITGALKTAIIKLNQFIDKVEEED